MTEGQTESTERTAAPETSADAPSDPAANTESQPAADTASEPAADIEQPAAATAAYETESGGTSPAEADAAAGPQSLTERPEVLVGAAFAGGLLLALVLRAVGDD